MTLLLDRPVLPAEVEEEVAAEVISTDLPTPLVLHLLAREPLDRPTLSALWNSRSSDNGWTTVVAGLHVLDRLHDWSCALTHEFIERGQAAEQEYGYSLYAVDSFRERTHWARVDLIGA